MKARNYNKVLSVLAIVGLTTSLAFLIENFTSETNSTIKPEKAIQLEENDSIDGLIKVIEQVKIYNAQDALIAEFTMGDPMSDETLKLFRQADFLSKFDNIAIYKLGE